MQKTLALLEKNVEWIALAMLVAVVGYYPRGVVQRTKVRGRDPRQCQGWW